MIDAEEEVESKSSLKGLVLGGSRQLQGNARLL
jgi:hypothetical protein